MKNMLHLSTYVLSCLLCCLLSPACGDEPQASDWSQDAKTDSEDEEMNPISVSKVMDIPDLYDNSYMQSMAIYGDYAFVINKKGGCRIVDLQQHQVIAETRLAVYV